MRHCHCCLHRAWDHNNNLMAMASLVNVKTLIKLFFSAFLFFFLLLVISAAVALPPKSSPPPAHSQPPLPIIPPRRDQVMTVHRQTTQFRSTATATATTTTTTTDQARDPAQYQELHIKNATPFFLDGESSAPRGGGGGLGGRRASTGRSGYNHNRRRRHHRAKTSSSGRSSSSSPSSSPGNKKKKKRIKTTSTSTSTSWKNDDVRGGSARPFSVMLPKGFVPPSGSSPCHNAKPDESTKAAATATYYSCRLSAAKP